MNWQHLQAFVRLRWRLMANQWRRGGRVNAALMMIVVVGLLVLAIPLFIGCFAIGWYSFPKATPTHLLYVWDGWSSRLRSSGASVCWRSCSGPSRCRCRSSCTCRYRSTARFVINYLSSLATLTTVIFLPLMFGLGLVPWPAGILRRSACCRLPRHSC